MISTEQMNSRTNRRTNTRLKMQEKVKNTPTMSIDRRSQNETDKITGKKQNSNNSPSDLQKQNSKMSKSKLTTYRLIVYTLSLFSVKILILVHLHGHVAPDLHLPVEILLTVPR